jgi:membrane protein DedA with SNARE-associated domain
MGAVGVGLLMLAENVLPPIPSELIMPLAGYLSSRGQMNFALAIAFGSVGSLVGSLAWYWVGRRVTRDELCGWVERHGAWLAMTPEDVDRVVTWFGRRGKYAVLLGRLMPVVRTLISLPAGFTRMPLPGFLLMSAVGTVLWTAGLALAGRWLGQRFDQVDRFVGPLSWVVIGGALAWYLYRVARIRAGRSASRAG